MFFSALSASVAANPLAGAVVIWYPSEATGINNNFIPNHATGRTSYKGIINRNFRTFNLGVVNGAAGAAGWLCGSGFGGTTIDSKYAVGLDGEMMASRISFDASATGSVRYRNGITVPAGDYRMVIDAKVVSGSADILMSKDGYSTSVTRTLTSALTRIEYTFTLGGSTALDLRFLKPSTTEASVYIIDNAILWADGQGTIPASPWTHDGALFLQNDAYQSTKISSGELVLGAENASSYFPAVTSEAFSYYVIAKRTGAYQSAGLGRYRFLHNPIDGSPIVFADEDGEGQLQSFWGNETHSVKSYGQANRPTGCSPDLLTNAAFNLLSWTGTADEIQGKIGDKLFAQNYIQNEGTAQSICSAEIGKNFGMAAYRLGPMALFYEQHSSVRQESVRSELITAYGTAVPTWTNSLVAAGDSITVGPASNSYAQQAMANLGVKAGTTVYNIEAVQGSMIQGNPTYNLNLNSRLARYCESVPNDLTGRRWVLTILIGANDLVGIGHAATWYAGLLAVVAPIRAKGVKVGLCTLLDEESPWPLAAAFMALQPAANTLIRASVGNSEADFVIDLQAVSGHMTGTPDGIHPSAAGHALMEPTYRAAILSQLL